MRTNSIKYLSIYEDLKEEIINGTYPIGGPVSSRTRAADPFWRK